MRESALLVLISFFFLVGVAFGAVTFHPGTDSNFTIPLGVIIAFGAVLFFIGMTDLVAKSLKK